MRRNTTRLNVPFLAAVGLSFVSAVVVGGLLEWLILKPFRRDELNGMIVTIGMAMILQNLALMVFGPDPLSMPAVAEGTLSMGSLVIPNSRVYVVTFALIAVVFFGISTAAAAWVVLRPASQPRIDWALAALAA